MKLRFIHLALAIGGLALLLQCSSEDKVVNEPRPPATTPDFTFARLDLASQNPASLPVPNDLLRNPFTGQVNLPPIGSPAADALIAQVNTLRGFSTTAPLRIPFDGKVVPGSVTNDSLIVVDLVDLNAAQQGVQVNPFREMSFDVREDETGADSVIFATPTSPLKPQRPHLVIITQGITGEASNLPVESESLTTLLKGETPFVDGAGNSTRASLDNQTAAALEPVRQIYQGIWAAAEAITQQDRLFIPLAYTFTTQPLYETLVEMRRRAQEENPVVTPLNSFVGEAQVSAVYNAFGLGAVPRSNVGAVYFGTFNAPNYIRNPLNGPFQGSGEALVEAGRNNLVVTSVTPPGPGPFPTIIYQHGFGSQKETMLLLADTACSLGFAVVGIDLVLHGGRSGDFINNQTGAQGPDGQPDPSGTNFLNLANVLVARDNLRQSTGDLFMLARLITSGAGDMNADGALEFAPVGVSFIGLSMGAIVGTSFLAIERDVSVANLSVPGGRTAYLLQESPTFGPAIEAGLAQFGLTPGTLLYDLYFIFAQAIVDDGDPANYGRAALTGELASDVPTATLLQEAIGDPVVPNFATRFMARGMGIDHVDPTDTVPGLNVVSAPHNGSGYFQFPDAAHGSLVAPDAATAAIRTQSFTFIGSALQGQPTVINPLNAGKTDALPPLVNLEALFNQDLTTMLRFPQPEK